MKIPAAIRWSILFVLLVVAGIFVWAVCAVFEPFAPHLPEPQYHGKKLTEWAREIDPTDFLRLSVYQQHPKQNAVAIAAIRHIGTNALPFALELCRARDPWLRIKWETWTHRYNFPALDRHFEGINIVWALGSMTKPIVPDLVQLLKSNDREIVDDTMFYTLPGVGTNAIPPLLELISDTNSAIRLRAAIALASFFEPPKPASEANGLLITPGSEKFRAQARTAVPVLLDGLQNSKLDLMRRLQIVQALGLIHEDAQTVVPILNHYAQVETNILIRRAYTSALKKLTLSTDKPTKAEGNELLATDLPEKQLNALSDHQTCSTSLP